jgi:AcrR family transcriptional regulator
VRNPEATRRRILAAALSEFSAKGISGARVDRIAARARTNKRMLYHYFGSKEGLYRAVLHQRLAGRVPTTTEPGLSEAERLARLHERLASSRDYVRLQMWEALERGTRPTVESEEARRANLAAMVDAIRGQQADGNLPSGLDPELLALAELALVVYPYAFPQITRMLCGQLPDESFRDRYATFLAQLASLLAPVGASE